LIVINQTWSLFHFHYLEMMWFENSSAHLEEGSRRKKRLHRFFQGVQLVVEFWFYWAWKLFFRGRRRIRTKCLYADYWVLVFCLMGNCWLLEVVGLLEVGSFLIFSEKKEKQKTGGGECWGVACIPQLKRRGRRRRRFFFPRHRGMTCVHAIYQLKEPTHDWKKEKGAQAKKKRQ
jgi:hypothetical protein